MSDTTKQELERKLGELSSSEDLLKECNAVETEIAALKSRYEQYFLGTERSRPAVAHNVLRKRIENLRSTVNRTTAVQFRVKNITNKFLTYERLWNRTLNEIENSKYRRDLFKARLHAKNRGSDGSAAGKSASKSKADRATAPPPSDGPGELTDAKLRAIYDAYLSAKKRCQEDVSKLSFESIASKLRKQVPDLMKKHNASTVEFKVVIKNGKAVLKAVPKNNSGDSK